jgi:ubiquitin-conjugating enzyme E2 A
MSTPAQKRLIRDLKRLQKDSPEGIDAAPAGNDIMHWRAVIMGPNQTPWEGGVFKLLLEFTEDYPNVPPTVQFESKIFHPNVYANGKICLDILKSQWSAIYDIMTVLLCCQSLLSDPNPASAANPEASAMFENDRREYLRRVRVAVEESWRADEGEEEDEGEGEAGSDADAEAEAGSGEGLKAGGGLSSADAGTAGTSDSAAQESIDADSVIPMAMATATVAAAAPAAAGAGDQSGARNVPANVFK